MAQRVLKCSSMVGRSSAAASTFQSATRAFIKFLGALILVLGLGTLPEASTAPVVIHSGCPLSVSLQFSPSGGELACICAFNPVRLLDTNNFRKARTFLPEVQHTPELASLSYSPDGKLIATARGWAGALIWNAADPGKPKPELKSFFGVDELYALETPLLVVESPAIVRGPEGRVHWIRFSPDGKLLLTTHGNGHVNIWSTGSWTQQGELAVADIELSAVAFAPNGKIFIAADERGVLHEWSLDTKSEIRVLRAGEHITGLEFSHDGRMLVATRMGKTFADASVIIWDAKDWSGQTEDGYTCAAFSDTGKLLALGGQGHVKVIEPSSRKEIRTFPLPEITKGELLRNTNGPDANKKMPYPASALAFSPDGNTLAVGGVDGTIILIHPNVHI